MITEAEVQGRFRRLFQSGEADAQTLQAAEELLECLRPESPLRYRLEQELDDIRRITGFLDDSPRQSA